MCKGSDAAVHMQLFDIEAQIGDMDRPASTFFCRFKLPKRADDCSLPFTYVTRASRIWCLH